jgi:hypothetical protein
MADMLPHPDRRAVAVVTWDTSRGAALAADDVAAEKSRLAGDH